MSGKVVPVAMDGRAHGADKFPTVAAVARGRLLSLLALSTHYLLRLFHLLQCVLDLKEVVAMERWLEVRHVSSRGKEGGLSAGGAA